MFAPDTVEPVEALDPVGNAVADETPEVASLLGPPPP